jgi:hypothetical protein
VQPVSTADKPRNFASSLSANAWQEATNLRLSLSVDIWPNYAGPEAIRLGHNRRFRNHEPLTAKPHPIAVIRPRGVPIDIIDLLAVRDRAAQAPTAGELVEPFVEGITGAAKPSFAVSPTV